MPTGTAGSRVVSSILLTPPFALPNRSVLWDEAVRLPSHSEELAIRIGIIGSGVSGLGAAYVLAQAHDVEVFERDTRAGGHANTVLHDGLALDTIFISRAFDQDEDELRRADRVAQSIEKALRGQMRLGDAVEARREQSRGANKAFTLAPDLMMDNNLSSRYTVIEVSGLDRPGLLYEMTAALSDLNLNIGSAHIATFGEKAVDVFYVTDLTGAKIINPARQSAIRRRILDIFTPGEAKAATKAAAKPLSKPAQKRTKGDAETE